MIARMMVFIALGLGPLAFSGGCGRAASPADDRDAIERVLRAYEKGINTGDTALIVEQFSDDAVWKPAKTAALVGKAAIQQRYERELNRISLDKVYQIHDLEVACDLAFIRATSEGTVALKATMEKAPESHEDVFILQRSPGSGWKITLYIYNNNLSREAEWAKGSEDFPPGPLNIACSRCETRVSC